MFDIGRMPIHAEQKDKEQRHFSFFNKSALRSHKGTMPNRLVRVLLRSVTPPKKVPNAELNAKSAPIDRVSSPFCWAS